MTRFEASVDSEADVEASAAAVWAVLTDPAALARLTPLLTHIVPNGDVWTWHMSKVGGLGISITPVFTEDMKFDEETSIVFSHSPPPGSVERIGVNGRYDLTDAPQGVHLSISLTVIAELPLPRAAGPAVKRAMLQTMNLMGKRFSRNLLVELEG